MPALDQRRVVILGQIHALLGRPRKPVRNQARKLLFGRRERGEIWRRQPQAGNSALISTRLKIKTAGVGWNGPGFNYSMRFGQRKSCNRQVADWPDDVTCPA